MTPRPDDLFKALADETRLRCLVLLANEGELCVCELTQATGVSQPKISRHLAALRRAGLVTDRRRGLWVFYSIDPSLPAWARNVLRATATGVAGQEPFASDRAGLQYAQTDADRCQPLEEAPMTDSVTRPFNVLFLCTGNSARSVMAEVLVNHWGQGRFRGFSAGSRPAGAVHPLTLKLLQDFRLPTDGLRCKSWDEFAAPDAPPMDFVFTVCDDAAGEDCPVWPGQPITAHWGVPDPVAAEGTELERLGAFREAFRQLENRIRIFCSLRLEALSRLALQREVERIGRLLPDDSARPEVG